MAYALMGFHQNQRPDVKMIKLRYKQLSKIYHPDLHGSEEEMKRLNSAVKIVIDSVNKSLQKQA
ncbi:DnaJ domain [Vibrio cholerae]|nr:DnaJ domain [Vibrio cholerae]